MLAQDFLAAVSSLQHVTAPSTCFDFSRVCEGCQARAAGKIHIVAPRY
jgi:hypothetical protein